MDFVEKKKHAVAGKYCCLVLFCYFVGEKGKRGPREGISAYPERVVKSTTNRSIRRQPSAMLDPLRSPYDAANTISQAASTDIGKDSTNSGTSAAPEGGETHHRSGSEVRNILERTPADSDNGRRAALGAIRTKLESMAREVSPEQLEWRAEGGKAGGGGRVSVGKGDDVRKVVELREAIWGAVGILSGISG